MGIGDFFRIGRIKQEGRAAAEERDRLKARLQDTLVMDVVGLREAADKARNELGSLTTLIAEHRGDLVQIQLQLASKRAELVQTDDVLMLQEFGLYEPKYRLTTAAEYRIRLEAIRDRQKAMIRAGTACYAGTSWTVNGSTAEGNRMVRSHIKLILRAFNTECDAVVDGVKFYNFDAGLMRIRKSYDAMNKLSETNQISIVPDYYGAKIEELELAYEWALKKQDEKDEQKKLKEQAREDAKLQREIEAARESLAKEEKHFRRALAGLQNRLGGAVSEDDRALIEGEIASIELKLGDIDVKRKDVDYRAQNGQAGFVYIISNVGAFGNDVYKIGVTRRLDPQERVDELGDASVPFDFDVHAMIFSDDAYGLEAALHRHFSCNRLNMVNGRKEFFRAQIHEIEAVLRRNFSKPVEFILFAEAAEYRRSLKLGAPQEVDRFHATPAEALPAGA